MASMKNFLLVFFFLAFSQVLNGGELDMEQEEINGLHEVMGSLLGDPNWAQAHPQPCTETPWPGVQCEPNENQTFHVTTIHIGPDVINPPCHVAATIPLSLHKLSYLKTLSLFSCFTSTPFSLSPFLFKGLTYLEHLALGSNPTLNGPIPQSLAQIATLRVLSLAQNNFQGEIPKYLGGLVNLEQLDLSYNNLSGVIPQEIGGLKRLQILGLSFNGLEGPIPSSLGQLCLLQKVDLCSNKLNGEVPSSLGQLNRLVLLDLSHNLFSGPISQDLSGLENLEYLVLDNNPLNTRVPLFLGKLKKLMVMSLSRCGLIGPLPNEISFLKNLTDLSLDRNSLNGTLPLNLGTLANLGQLNLSFNQLSGEINLPNEFIMRLGKRLDLRGNNDLCLNQEVYKDKSILTYMDIPPCLGTRLRGENNKSDNPILGNGRESSRSVVINVKLVLHSLVVWIITLSIGTIL